MDTPNTVDSVMSHYGTIEFGLEGTLNYSLRRLWITFWGKAAPTTSIWNLEMLETQLNYTKGKLVLLEQYPLVLDQLRTHQQSTVPIPFRGILITGSPGIGKTCCLWYLLVVHLCMAEPVALLYDNQLHVFTGSGLYSLTETTYVALETVPFRKVLCLVDMDAKGSNFWSRVLSRSSACFTVAASAPQRRNYHAWVKQCRIATIVLGAPSKGDLRDELVPQSTDEETLDYLLDIFGPNIRALVPVIHNLSAVRLQLATELYIVAMQQHLERLDEQELGYLVSRPDSLSNPFLHTLVYIYGTEAIEPGDETIIHRIPTPLVLRLLLQLHQQSRLALRDMYELFSASSHLAVSRGWAFEVLCHAKICEMDELILHPVSEHGNKLKKTDGAPPVHVPIGKRRMEIYAAGRGVETTVDTECYYVPAEGNNPTFDAFVPGEASLALQMFIGRTHTFKAKGVTMFRKRLMAFDKGRNWKINKMKFAFVVPTGHAFEVPTRRLRDVDFFVLELDVGKQYERFYKDEHCEDHNNDSDANMDDEMTP